MTFSLLSNRMLSRLHEGYDWIEHTAIGFGHEHGCA